MSISSTYSRAPALSVAVVALCMVVLQPPRHAVVRSFGSPNDLDDPRWYYVDNILPFNVSTYAIAGAHDPHSTTYKNGIVLLGSVHIPRQRCVFNTLLDDYGVCDNDYTDTNTYAGSDACTTLNELAYCTTHDYDIVVYDMDRNG